MCYISLLQIFNIPSTSAKLQNLIQTGASKVYKNSSRISCDGFKPKHRQDDNVKSKIHLHVANANCIIDKVISRKYNR